VARRPQLYKLQEKIRMSNRWNIPNIPHKGWTLIEVIDIREDGQTEDETDYETCMMCNNEKIRYVHILSHPEVNEDFKVGCICAEKLTEDYVTSRELEKKLKQRTTKRTTWLKKNWKETEKGNLSILYQEHRLIIFKDVKTNKFKSKIGETWGKKEYDTIEQAKLAVFKNIEYLKENNKW
jgi:hypothetical protein